MKNSKNNGQVFTPDYIIDQLLDEAGYFNDAILNKTVLEPAFGDGRIIKKIIDRIISVCVNNGFTAEQTLAQIKNNVYGFELDGQLYHFATNDVIKHIDDEIGKLFGKRFNDIDVNLYHCDALKQISLFPHFFDFIIGNPPYIRVHNLGEKEMLKTFRFSQNGTGDIYLAFYDAGIQMLNKTGKLVFITPNSWFKTKSGKVMRDYITNNAMLKKIIDFKHKQIFENFTTYTEITVLDKSHGMPFVMYVNGETGTGMSKPYRDIILNDTFCFGFSEQMREYRDVFETEWKGFCEVKNGYATLMDGFFIDNDEMPDSEYIIKVCKAGTGKFHKCFYPYDKNGTPLSFDKIKKDNPELSVYLENNKEKLLKRNIEDGGLWYTFGRTQAINDTRSKKVAVNSTIKPFSGVSLTECEAGTGVYGGLYIKTNHSAKEITEILDAEDFYDFLSNIGTYKSGGYYSISSKQLEKYLNYMFLKKTLKPGVSVQMECFGRYEPVEITTVEDTLYGFYCNTVAEDGAYGGFFIKNFGKSVKF